MPAGLKATSSLITISAGVTESAPNTFTQAQVDLQLNPLDNEVFVVYAVDLDILEPNLVAGTDTAIRGSLTTTSKTAVSGISNSSCIAANRISIQEEGGAFVRGAYASDSAPASNLDYLAIIATNDFFLQIEGSNNALARAMNARLYGVRMRADSSVYAALVQSEMLSQ